MTKKDISMKYYIALFVAMLCLASCSNHSAHWPTLLQVGSFIEQHPDSAFAVLQRIDVAELASSEERARHANVSATLLQYSQAMSLLRGAIIFSTKKMR